MQRRECCCCHPLTIRNKTLNIIINMWPPRGNSEEQRAAAQLLAPNSAQFVSRALRCLRSLATKVSGQPFPTCQKNLSKQMSSTFLKYWVASQLAAACAHLLGVLQGCCPLINVAAANQHIALLHHNIITPLPIERAATIAFCSCSTARCSKTHLLPMRVIHQRLR